VNGEVPTADFTGEDAQTKIASGLFNPQLIAEPKSVATPPAPSPATYYQISTALEIFASDKKCK
jgi:hypothetical protein